MHESLPAPSGYETRPPFAAGMVVALAGIKLTLHLVVNLTTPYGFHRDELLYLAMGKHLRLWSMDFPPAIALLAEFTRFFFGDSLTAVRLPPALLGAGLVVLAALLARELGGGRAAQGLAAFAVLVCPLFLRSANLFQPVVLDQVAWTLALFALVRLCRGSGSEWWLALGVALGVGLLSKFSIGFIGIALAVGIAASPLRAALLTPWPWGALGIALLIGSPSLVGQFRLGFPVVGQMADLQATQLVRVSPADYVLGQLLWGPVVLLAWSGGAGLLLAERLRPFRAVGWTCLAAFVLLLLLQGKSYYIGPVYPMLFAAGGLLLEGLGDGPLAEALHWGTVAVLFAFGIVILPLGVPILQPRVMAGYAAALGATPALRTNTGELEALPQDFADMLGWREQVAAVSRAYHDLPPGERHQAVIVAANYGQAGAVDFFGPGYDLPDPVSPAGSYWFFGPGRKRGDVVVTLGVSREGLEPLFDSVRTADVVTHPWAVAEERRVPVLVGRGARRSLQELWPSLAARD